MNHIKTISFWLLIVIFISLIALTIFLPFYGEFEYKKEIDFIRTLWILGNITLAIFIATYLKRKEKSSNFNSDKLISLYEKLESEILEFVNSYEHVSDIDTIEVHKVVNLLRRRALKIKFICSNKGVVITDKQHENIIQSLLSVDYVLSDYADFQVWHLHDCNDFFDVKSICIEKGIEFNKYTKIAGLFRKQSVLDTYHIQFSYIFSDIYKTIMNS